MCIFPELHFSKKKIFLGGWGWGGKGMFKAKGTYYRVEGITHVSPQTFL